MSIYDENSWLYSSLRRETRRDICRANRIMWRGLAILCVLWALGLALFVWQTKPHHGHAVYVPGGIEVYP